MEEQDDANIEVSKIENEVHSTTENRSVENDDDHINPATRCCSACCYNNVREAKGFALLLVSRSTTLMSLLFLSTSLVYLASKEAGCVDEDDNIIENCDKRVYGFLPSSIVTNIALFEGIMAAFLFPIAGAMIDYTPHRRTVGIIFAIVIIAVQATQIGTNASTWFAMTILASVGGFSSEVMALCADAYLPEMARDVGKKTMTGFTATFMQIQMVAQVSFLVLVSVLGQVFELDDVQIAHLGQSINTICVLALCCLGWRLLPNVNSKHELKENQSLFKMAFVQLWNTMKNINKFYGRGLRWFYLSSCFSDGAAYSTPTISLAILTNTLHMSASEVGYVALVSTIAAIPGAQLGAFVTRRTNPSTSLKLSIVLHIIATTIAAFILNNPDQSNYAYFCGILWGLALGWFFPAETMIFSLCLPKNQEAEFSGLFHYCTQILYWLPSLLYTLLNETGVHKVWGVMSLNIFMVIGITLLMIAAPWDEMVLEARKTADYEEKDTNIVETVNVLEPNDENKA